MIVGCQPRAGHFKIGMTLAFFSATPNFRVLGFGLDVAQGFSCGAEI